LSSDIHVVGSTLSTSEIGKSPSQLYLKHEILDLSDEHTSHKKWIWDFRMTEIMKSENILEGNLHNLFTLLMSFCDSNKKTQVKASPSITFWR